MVLLLHFKKCFGIIYEACLESKDTSRVGQ